MKSLVVCFCCFGSFVFGMDRIVNRDNGGSFSFPLLELKEGHFIAKPVKGVVPNIDEVERVCSSVPTDSSLLRSALGAYQWLYDDIKYGWSGSLYDSVGKESILSFIKRSEEMIAAHSSSASSCGSDASEESNL